MGNPSDPRQKHSPAASKDYTKGPKPNPAVAAANSRPGAHSGRPPNTSTAAPTPGFLMEAGSGAGDLPTEVVAANILFLGCYSSTKNQEPIPSPRRADSNSRAPNWRLEALRAS